MRKYLTLLLLGIFSFAIVGCEASGSLGDDEDGDRYMKKTTTVDEDGDRTVKTEVKTTDRD